MSAKEKLGPGDTFPALTLCTVGGGEVVLPRDIATPYAIILFYRGYW